MEVQSKRKTEQGLPFDNLCLLVSWLRIPVKSACCAEESHDAVSKRTDLVWANHSQVLSQVTGDSWEMSGWIREDKSWGGFSSSWPPEKEWTFDSQWDFISDWRHLRCKANIWNETWSTLMSAGLRHWLAAYHQSQVINQVIWMPIYCRVFMSFHVAVQIISSSYRPPLFIVIRSLKPNLKVVREKFGYLINCTCIFIINIQLCRDYVM